MLHKPFPPGCASNGCGPLSRMDARIKLLSAALCLASIAAIQGYMAALAVLLFALGLAMGAGIPPRSILLRLVPANIFFLVLGMVLGLTYPGPSLRSIPWISPAGLELTLGIALKGNALLLVCITLVCTTSVPALSQALHALGVPLKLTLLLAFTHRQIFLVLEEYRRLSRAALARGFTRRCTMHAYKTLAVLFGQTLLRSMARAERIHGAMLLRGFTGRFYSLDPPTLAWRDGIPALALALIPAIICIHDRWFL